jgi:paraquat-inducible protein B
MAETPDVGDAPQVPGDPPVAGEALPQPRVVRRRRWNISLVWLVPAVAIGIAASMLVRSIFLTGPRIEIDFKSAEGVEAGNPIPKRWRSASRSVGLRDDRERVGAVVQPDPSAARASRSRTRALVVKPRIGAGGVSDRHLAPRALHRHRRGRSTGRAAARWPRHRPWCCAASRSDSCCAPGPAP